MNYEISYDYYYYSSIMNYFFSLLRIASQKNRYQNSITNVFSVE